MNRIVINRHNNKKALRHLHTTIYLLTKIYTHKEIDIYIYIYTRIHIHTKIPSYLHILRDTLKKKLTPSFLCRTKKSAR